MCVFHLRYSEEGCLTETLVENLSHCVCGLLHLEIVSNTIFVNEFSGFNPSDVIVLFWRLILLDFSNILFTL